MTSPTPLLAAESGTDATTSGAQMLQRHDTRRNRVAREFVGGVVRFAARYTSHSGLLVPRIANPAENTAGKRHVPSHHGRTVSHPIAGPAVTQFLLWLISKSPPSATASSSSISMPTRN